MTDSATYGLSWSNTGDHKVAVLFERTKPWPKACRFGRQHTYSSLDGELFVCADCGRVPGHDDVQVNLDAMGYLVLLADALTERAGLSDD